MITRGLLFSGAMARANAAGAKTETRRASSNANARALLEASRRGEPVRLYQREAFRLETNFDPMPPSALKALSFRQMPVWFEAERGAPATATRSEWGHPFGRLRAGIHMPKWASRLTLDVVEIREEPLGALSDESARAEGIEALTMRGETRYGLPGRYAAPSASADGWDWEDWQPSPRQAYFRLYAAVNGASPDAIDPAAPVIVIRYAVRERNILDIEQQEAA